MSSIQMLTHLWLLNGPSNTWYRNLKPMNTTKFKKINHRLRTITGTSPIKPRPEVLTLWTSKVILMLTQSIWCLKTWTCRLNTLHSKLSHLNYKVLKIIQSESAIKTLFNNFRWNSPSNREITFKHCTLVTELVK